MRVASHGRDGGVGVVGRIHLSGRDGRLPEGVDALGEVHAEGLHGDSRGAVGEARVEFVLEGDEGFDLGDAVVVEGLGDVLDVHDGNDAQRVGRFVDESRVLVGLSVRRGMDLDDLDVGACCDARRVPEALRECGERGGGARALDIVREACVAEDEGVESAVVGAGDEGDSAGGVEEFDAREVGVVDGAGERGLWRCVVPCGGCGEEVVGAEEEVDAAVDAAEQGHVLQECAAA